jgi:hypothetical protein
LRAKISAWLSFYKKVVQCIQRCEESPDVITVPNQFNFREIPLMHGIITMSTVSFQTPCYFGLRFVEGRNFEMINFQSLEMCL